MPELPLGLSLWLDLAGTFVFGLSGAMLGVRKGLDAFGLVVLALAAGLAGGVLRDVALGATPPAGLADSRYLLAAMAAAATVFFAHRLIEKATKPVMMLDSLGLGLFAVAGCTKALAFGLDPLPAVLLGVVSAVGGGALRDLLVAETPRVLREEVYALAALLGASVAALGARMDWPETATAAGAVALTCLLRIVSVRRGWRAPKAPGS